MEKMISIDELKEKINLENSRFFIVQSERLDLETAKSIYVSNFSLNTPIEKISYVIQRWDMEARMSIFYFVQELQEESSNSLFGKFSYDNIAEHNLKDIIMLYDNMVNIIDNTTLSVYDLTHEEEKLEDEQMKNRNLLINNTRIEFDNLLCISIEMDNPAKGFKTLSILLGKILGTRFTDDKNKPTWFVERVYAGVLSNNDKYSYLIVVRVVAEAILSVYDTCTSITELSKNNVIINSDKYMFNIFSFSEELILNYAQKTTSIKRMYTVYAEDAAPQFYNLIHLNSYANDIDNELGITFDERFSLILNNLESYDNGDTTLLDLKTNDDDVMIEENIPVKASEKDTSDEPSILTTETEEVNVPKEKVKVIMSNLTFVPGAQGLPQILMNEYIASINSYFDKLNISIPEVKFEVNNNSQYGYINVATGVSVTLINPELSVLALYNFMKIYNLTNVHFCKED